MACGRKIDAEPAVLAQYNPARVVLEEPYYPDGFNRHDGAYSSA